RPRRRDPHPLDRSAERSGTHRGVRRCPSRDARAEVRYPERYIMITRSWGLLLTPFLLAAAPLGNPDPAQVTGLSLAPAGGEAELVVAMSGSAVRWSDFTLDNPSRVVLDITGARSALARTRFEGIDRAGIGSVRTSQYSADVVRVVVDLNRPVAYTV